MSEESLKINQPFRIQTLNSVQPLALDYKTACSYVWRIRFCIFELVHEHLRFLCDSIVRVLFKITISINGKRLTARERKRFRKYTTSDSTARASYTNNGGPYINNFASYYKFIINVIVRYSSTT